MKTIELTKEQMEDVIRGVELLIRESEDEFGKLRFLGCDSKMAKMFKNDIKKLKELDKYLKSKL